MILSRTNQIILQTYQITELTLKSQMSVTNYQKIKLVTTYHQTKTKRQIKTNLPKNSANIDKSNVSNKLPKSNNEDETQKRQKFTKEI